MSARIVIGLHSVREALRVRSAKIARAFLKDNWKDSPELSEIEGLLRSKKVKIEIVGLSRLDKFGHGHQGVAVEVAENPTFPWSKLDSAHQSIVVALDGIEDPQNLGSILRTGWLLGVHGILIPKDRAAPLTATVSKVACGGAEHVPVEEHGSLTGPLNTLKEKDFFIFGLSEKGEKSLWDLKIPEKVVWVVGSEEKGIRPATGKLVDEFVSIPQTNSKASLNAAIAAALALGETARQLGGSNLRAHSQKSQ